MLGKSFTVNEQFDHKIDLTHLFKVMMLIKCFPKCKDETINGDNTKEKWFLKCNSTSKCLININVYHEIL